MERQGTHLPRSGFPIRVAVADDHVILRQALRAMLSHRDAIDVVGEYGNGREAIDGVAQVSPEIVLMDVAMPQLNGLDATRQLKRAAPAVKVIIMSSAVGADQLRDAIAAGACGYVTKLTHVDELLVAIQSVHRGNNYFSADIARDFDLTTIMRDARSSDQRTGTARLSVREREVLQLLAEGYTSKRIAAELYISPKTVEGHKARILERLQLKTRTELIRFALAQGMTADTAAPPDGC